MTEAPLRRANQISRDRPETPSTVVSMSRATAAKHATATIVLHWGTVTAIVIMVAAIYLRDLTEDKAIRQLLLDVHRQFGLLVMIGVPIRILARYWLGFADQTSSMAKLLRWAAAGTHMVLYASLIALPVLGWAATSAKGVALSLFGLVPLPSLATPDPDVADALLDYHQWFGWALFGLVAMHALAALWHHFVRRDGVLAAMLPSHRPDIGVPRGANIAPADARFPGATIRPIRIGVLKSGVSVRTVTIGAESDPPETGRPRSEWQEPTVETLASRRGYPLRRLLLWERLRSSVKPRSVDIRSAEEGERHRSGDQTPRGK